MVIVGIWIGNRDTFAICCSTVKRMMIWNQSMTWSALGSSSKVPSADGIIARRHVRPEAVGASTRHRRAESFTPVAVTAKFTAPRP